MPNQAASEGERQWQFLSEHHPQLAKCLSALGRAATMPADIPEQAAEARGKEVNATIGQITDGKGRPLALSAVEEALSGIVDRDRAILYSPIGGLPEMRAAWRAWQRRGIGDELPSSLPVVTVGLSHGLSLLADIFAEEETSVVVPTPFWGNYAQMFALRRGAVIESEEAYVEGVFQPHAWQKSLDRLPEGKPAVTIVNFPSNPGGYFPNHEERRVFVNGLLQAADRRPIVAIFDDAYAGLVYEDDCDPKSVFWDVVAARHPNLLAVKLDGGTKEFSYFGGRVGFITFGLPVDSELATILESKIKCMSRALLGSPAATAQVVLLQALQAKETVADIEAIRVQLGRRYRRVRNALDRLDRDLLLPLACNSGCFALVEIPERLGLTAEQVRRRLLDVESVGVVSIAPRYLRIALCSLHEDDSERTVEAMERAVRDLAGAS